MHNSGLRNVGAPCEDAASFLDFMDEFPTFLRKTSQLMDTDKDEYYLRVTGTVRETTALGENLILERYRPA